MQPIIIPFTPNRLGRIVFESKVMTGDRKSLGTVMFKLDTGSDFTTISCDELKLLGYTQEYLKSCPHHVGGATLAADEHKTTLQYIPNVSIKFDDRELQHCRIYFALGTKLRSLFGGDILKYFNIEINNNEKEIRLSKREDDIPMLDDEMQIQIYSIEQG